MNIFKRILDHFRPSLLKPDPGLRNAKGEWRPPYPIKYAPLVVWPPKPVKLLKWFVSWPGFMWPVNMGLLAISAAAWFWTQPDIARCATFKWDWLLQIWARNFALTWIFYGGAYWYLYILKGEGTKGKYDVRWPARNSRGFLFNDQVLDNMFWTAGVAVVIWTGIEAVGLWLFANHYIAWLNWKEHPVLFVAWLFVIPFWREFHFYWVHRLIHWKPLYKYVHYLHHKNINPIPWSGMAMHPIETFLYLSVSMIHWIVPSHPFHFLFDLQHAAIGPVSGHQGFEGPLLEGTVATGSYFHYLHHRYFECNYGESALPLDKWFGTFRDGTPDGAGANLHEEHRYSGRAKTTSA